MATRKVKDLPPVEEMETEFIDLDDMEDVHMNYQSMDINDIINWCKEHEQVEWLKETMKTKVPYKQYPRKKGDPRKDKETGAILTNKKGEILYTYVADKSQAPKIVYREPNFMHIKNAFVDKFMPEIKPVAKPKNPTMYDLINSL